jgi:hypothetical protein
MRFLYAKMRTTERDDVNVNVDHFVYRYKNEYKETLPNRFAKNRAPFSWSCLHHYEIEKKKLVLFVPLKYTLKKIIYRRKQVD